MAYKILVLLIALTLSGCTIPDNSYIVDPETLDHRPPSMALSTNDFMLIAAKVSGTVLPVYGWSMYPSIPPWSDLVIEPMPYEDLRLGDVIVYQSSFGTLICHRIVAISSQGLQVKGDNNQLPDKELVMEHMYAGRVKVVELP